MVAVGLKAKCLGFSGRGPRGHWPRVTSIWWGLDYGPPDGVNVARIFTVLQYYSTTVWLPTRHMFDAKDAHISHNVVVM